MPAPLIVASHNAGKLREIVALLAPLAIPVRSAAELGLPEPDETGDTFEANAALKARAAALGAHGRALADDSGLVVPALDGAPGIFSARWAGLTKDFALAMHRVEEALRTRDVTPTGTPAYFVCVLALADMQGNVRCIRGEVHGKLAFPPRGTQGFGYDPIFIPDGHTQTFGELDPAVKERIGHRAHAFAALLPLLEKEQSA